MSLPVPSSSSGPVSLDPRELQALDAPLIALTNQCGGDLRRLMFAFFSFLNRRTDFYLVPHPDDVERGDPVTMGFREGDAEKLLLAAFRQFPLRRIPSKKNQPTTPPEAAAAAAATKTAAKTIPTSPSHVAAGATAPTTSTLTTCTTSDEKDTKSDVKSSETKSEDKTGTTTGNPSDTTKTVTEKADAVGNLVGVEYSEDGLQVPVGNGGSSKRYKWTQTIDECTVIIGLPEGLKGKDLFVSITPTSIAVKSKAPLVLGGQDDGSDSPHVFVEGKLLEKIRSDESTWSLEGGVLVLVLEKLKKTFWKTVIEGDDEIDTDLVDSKRHISEYDGATQGQIRKIIFDQNQERRGLPTSDKILGKPAIPSTLPEMPPGVEFIDSKKVDENLPKVGRTKS
jgi:hypothetical protein